MSLVKVSSGRLEKENFFMDSSVSDFLGNGEWSRTTDYFKLHKEVIKRSLPYSEFVIDIRKDIAFLEEDDIFSFFIEDKTNRMGLLEENTKSKEFWRLIYHENFAQIFTSDDGMDWENHGGEFHEYSEELLQGFYQQGGKILTLRNYNVYKSPFLTIWNFKPGTVVRLYSIAGEYIKEREFDASWTCEIFLDYNIKGYLEFFQGDSLVFVSDVKDFEHGDVYLYPSTKLQLLHDGVILDSTTTTLHEYVEKLILRNPENKSIGHVHLKIDNPNLDKIEISRDGQNYYTEMVIDKVEAYEDIPIYLRIIRYTHYSKFEFKEFNVVIYSNATMQGDA